MQRRPARPGKRSKPAWSVPPPSNHQEIRGVHRKQIVDDGEGDRGGGTVSAPVPSGP
jgi:hypothetical protein